MQASVEVSDDDEYADCRTEYFRPLSEKFNIFDSTLVLTAAYFHSITWGERRRLFLFSELGGSMAQVARAKTKYVPAWMTPQQYEKLAALKMLRGTSINGVL